MSHCNWFNNSTRNVLREAHRETAWMADAPRPAFCIHRLFQLPSALPNIFRCVPNSRGIFKIHLYNALVHCSCSNQSFSVFLNSRKDSWTRLKIYKINKHCEETIIGERDSKETMMDDSLIKSWSTHLLFSQTELCVFWVDSVFLYFKRDS